jgi:alpha-tubulin suppressor-like RCC1 family protein
MPTTSSFVTTDGGVLMIGGGQSGVLGTGSEENIGNDPNETSSVVPIVFGTADPAVAVVAPPYASESSHICALFANGGVRCWGEGNPGALGQGSTDDIGDDAAEMAALPFIKFGTTDAVMQVAVGATHNCAVFLNGGVRCWGAGNNGRLGTGNADKIGDGPNEMTALKFIEFEKTHTATQTVVGSAHSCALFNNGGVRCWGNGGSGRLGTDSTDHIGDKPDQMSLLGFIKFGTDEAATQVTAGSKHNCALFVNGGVRCWGAGSDGRLGTDGTDNVGDGTVKISDVDFIKFKTDEAATQVAAGSTTPAPSLSAAVCGAGGRVVSGSWARIRPTASAPAQTRFLLSNSSPLRAALSRSTFR